MAEILEYMIALRFFGDDLDPDEVSEQLGGKPTSACRKGDVAVGRVTNRKRIEKTGRWLLQLPDRKDRGLEPQLDVLFSSLTQDLKVWRMLTERFNGDVSCGAFLHSSNEGLELSPRILGLLSDRGLHLGLDVYEQDRDSEN